MIDVDEIDFLDQADYLGAYLKTVESLQGFAVLVDRDNDLESETNKAIEKNLGGLILIGFRGWVKTDADSSSHCYNLLHGVSLWTMPNILEERGLPPFGKVLFRLTSAMNFWQPEVMSPAREDHTWRVGNGSKVPADFHTVYEFTASIMEDFEDPIPPFVSPNN